MGDNYFEKMKKNQTLISIIVPCYNQVEYIDECLASVYVQTFSEWECIVVDDGSTDFSVDKIKLWVQKDPRFRLIRKQNSGVADTRNIGVENAKSNWILPLDADDMIGSEYLEKASLYFNDTFDIIYCKSMLFGTKTGSWKLPDYSYKGLLNENMIFNCAFFRKNEFMKLGGYDSQLIYGVEDWELWINLLKNSILKKVKQLDYNGFYYRIKETSRTSGIVNNQEKLNISLEYIYEKHKLEYEKFFGNYGRNLRVARYHFNQRAKIDNSKISKFLFKIILWLNR